MEDSLRYVVLRLLNMIRTVLLTLDRLAHLFKDYDAQLQEY